MAAKVNVLKHVSKAMVRLAPFEKSSSEAREFLRRAQVARLPTLQLTVQTVSPPVAAAADLTNDRFQSLVKLTLANNAELEFPAGVGKAQDLFKNLAEVISQDEVPEAK